MDLNLREISYFLKIAEVGSLSGAAAALSISQPALSRALKRLEERLGGELFLRHTLGVALTAYGEAFIDYAKILQSDADRTVQDLSLLKGASRGVARIGIVPSASSYLLPPAIDSAMTKSVGIRIHVVEAPSARLVADLEYGHLDFAIATSVTARNHENIRVSRLFREQMFVVARGGHPLASAGRCELSDLLAYPWIVPEKGNAILLEMRKAFMRVGLDPPVGAVSSNSVHTLKATVAVTDFLTMLPARSFSWEERYGVLQRIEVSGESSYREICVLRRVARPLLPAANIVLSAIRKHVSTFD